jgi:hypothetical protein
MTLDVTQAALSLLGGSVGGAVWNFAFETHIRPRRDARNLAQVLANEVAYNVHILGVLAREIDAGNTIEGSPPPLTSVVYLAAASQVAVLSAQTQTAVLVIYDALRGLNQAIALNHERYGASPPRESQRILRGRFDDVVRNAEQMLAELASAGAKPPKLGSFPYLTRRETT